MRPVCPECNINLCAVNYIRKGKTYYRKLCERCLKLKGKVKQPQHNSPRWQLAGYRKKPTCEHCGFKPIFKEQLTVFFVDGNKQSIDARNLKTVCLNCNIELSITGIVAGDLQEDL